MRKSPKAAVLAAFLALTLLVGVTAVAFAEEAGTSPSTEQTATPQETAPVDPWTDPAYRAQVKRYYDAAAKYRAKTHYWTHMRWGSKKHGWGTHRKWTMTHSLQLERERAIAWRGKAKAAYQTYLQWHRMWEARNRSMWKAVEAAAREYRVSASWLHSCISTEGGHGGWVMNHGGSGAGGWAQFMSSTFYGNVGSARYVNRFPRKYAVWTSRVGQAYTMAYMFKIGQSGQWTGSGC